MNFAALGPRWVHAATVQHGHQRSSTVADGAEEPQVAALNRNAAAVDFDQWAGLFAAVGARYVVMVTKHEDGFPMWPTRVANPHMPADYKASRDLVGDLAGAVRARGLRMGLYYAGGVDWTFKDTPIRTIADLMEHEALGSQYARYAAAHWRELIDDYQPSVLWNDMGWPAEQDPNRIIAHFYNSVEDGVVNDRWTQELLQEPRVAIGITKPCILHLTKSITSSTSTPRSIRASRASSMSFTTSCRP